MPFTNYSVLDDAYKARPAVMRMSAPTPTRIIGDMAGDAIATTLSLNAPTFNWSDLEFLASATLGLTAASFNSVGTWDAETALMNMRSPTSSSIIGDMVVGAQSASMSMGGNVGGDAQFENSGAASLSLVPIDADFFAYWEAQATTMGLSAVDVIVQIGDVLLQVNGATLSAIAPLVTASDIEFAGVATFGATANNADWAEYWDGVTAALFLRALNVSAEVGDMAGDAIAATLSLVAPLALGTESPVADAAIINLIAPQIGFEINWNAVSASMSMVAAAITALVGDRTESFTTITMTAIAPNANWAELGFGVTATLEFNAPTFDFLSYSDAIAAVMTMRANAIGEIVAQPVSAYDATVRHLDPSELDGVNLSDWMGWN